MIYSDEKYVVESFPSGQISYPTPRGAERRFPEYITASLPPFFVKMLKDMGKNPEAYFCVDGSVILRIEAKPVIEDALANRKLAKQKEEAEAAARKAARRLEAQALAPAGSEPCELQWANGDLCSAKYITSDGVEVIDSDLLPELGKTGFYAISGEKIEAERAKQKQAQAADQAAQAAAEQALQAATTQARETKTPQPLRTWVTDRCMRHQTDCCFDHAVESVHPDGTIHTKFTCCH